MRYAASEKFQIIELVEQSSLSIRRTLAPIGNPRSTFYDWYSIPGGRDSSFLGVPPVASCDSVVAGASSGNIFQQQ